MQPGNVYKKRHDITKDSSGTNVILYTEGNEGPPMTSLTVLNITGLTIAITSRLYTALFLTQEGLENLSTVRYIIRPIQAIYGTIFWCLFFHPSHDLTCTGPTVYSLLYNILVER